MEELCNSNKDLELECQIRGFAYFKLNIKKEEEEEEQEGNDNTTHYTTTADPSGVNTYYKILCVKDKNNNNKTVYNRLEPIDDFNYEVEFVYNYNLTTYCFARKIKRFVGRFRRTRYYCRSSYAD